MYIVIDKENNTRWAVANSFEKLITVCKYLKKNIKGSDKFYVVWIGENKSKEISFFDFCTLQEI